MNELLWHYRARVIRVIDGDSLLMELDTGFHTTRWESVRVLGVDAPEMVGASRAAGLEARAFVQAWTDEPGTWPFLVRTTKTDSFGRYLADVVRIRDGANLAQALLESGHAVVYR